MTETYIPPSRALLATAVVTWLVSGLGRATAEAGRATGSGAEQAAAFVGALIGTLVIVLLARSGIRMIRHQPVRDPLWTPQLFFVAAALNLLLILAALGQRAA